MTDRIIETIHGEKIAFMDIDEDEPFRGAFIGLLDKEGDRIHGPLGEGPGRYLLVREAEDDVDHDVDTE